jgi:hypothetical protein
MDIFARYLTGFHTQEEGYWRQKEVLAQEAQVSPLLVQQVLPSLHAIMVLVRLDPWQLGLNEIPIYLL